MVDVTVEDDGTVHVRFERATVTHHTTVAERQAVPGKVGPFPVDVVRKVVEDCERMLRFSPPPAHLAETNEWHTAIRNAQDLLANLPGGGDVGAG